MTNPPPSHRPRPRPAQPPRAVDITKPFRARDAQASGISRRRLRSKEFRRIIRGVYILASVPPDPLHEAMAVLLVAGEGAFVSHHTAALLYGAVVPGDPHLHASTLGDKHRSRQPGVVVHRSARVPSSFRSVRVTSAVDTFLDLSASLGLVDLVVLGDSLVKKGRCTPADLVAAASSAGRRALQAAALVRAGVDSPMETRLRLLVVLAGLPEPEVNIVLYDERGEVVRRIDLGYRAAKLGLEYDGRQHAESPRQYAADVRRRDDLDVEGWYIWTAVSNDIFRTPGDALERIVSAMQRRGMDVPPLKDDWRRHFPGW